MALWRIEEAADFLGIRPKTLYEWVRKDRVPYRKIGFNVRFDPAELQAWVAAQSRGPDTAETTAPVPAASLDSDVGEAGDARPRAPENLREMQTLIEAAAATLRALEREVGAELSYKRRQELSALAERLEITRRQLSRRG